MSLLEEEDLYNRNDLPIKKDLMNEFNQVSFDDGDNLTPLCGENKY